MSFVIVHQLAAILAQAGEGSLLLFKRGNLSTPETMQFGLPWQKPGLMGFVLGGQPLVPSPLGHLQRTAFVAKPATDKAEAANQAEPVAQEDAKEPAKPRARLALTAKAAPARKLKAYKAQDESERRTKLLAGWEEVLLKAPTASQTGAIMADPDEEPKEVLRLTLIDKATNTLAARLSAVSAYISWMPSAAHWPPSEKQAYDFVAQTANISAPATRATRFVEALGFMQGAFGFDFETLLASRRLTGFCAEQADRLPPRKQSPTVPLWVIKAIELKLIDEGFAEDEAIVAGAMLLMLSLRARFSDFRRVTQVTVTRNVIEVEVTVTKTSRKVSQNLPLVLRGPRVLTSGQDWWQKYDLARINAGIPFPSYPLFPYRTGEAWGPSQGRLTDFTEAMALIFSSVGFTPDVFPTSHGLKATFLAWACKFGIDKEAREALGYHVGSPKPGTVQVYARDRIEGPLAKLCSMLAEIQAGRFDPDDGDMLTWHMARKNRSVGGGTEDEDKIVQDSSSGSSSD